MNNNTNTEIIADVLGEERLKEICSLGITEERLLSMWHKTELKPTEFREAVDETVEEDNIQNAVEYAEMTIDNLTAQIETLQDMKAGIVTDKLKEQLSEKTEEAK